MDIDVVLERIKSYAGTRNDKDIARLFGVGPSDFSARKKRGTLLPLVIEWCLRQEMDIDLLLRGATIQNASREVENLGARLRAIRFRLDISQGELAMKISSSATAIGQYEKSEKVPGGKVLAGYVSLGFNGHWILTGEGPMETVGELQDDFLAEIIAEVEKALVARSQSLPPARKARLISYIYRQRPANISASVQEILELIESDDK